MVLKYILSFSKHLFYVLQMKIHFWSYQHLFFSWSKKRETFDVNLHVMLKPHLAHTDYYKLNIMVISLSI